MSTFGQDFLQGFTDVNSLRDYQHASRVFRTNAYELKPRFKFLFHVSFTINTQEIPALNAVFGGNAQDPTNLSLVVKTVDGSVLTFVSASGFIPGLITAVSASSTAGSIIGLK